MIQAFKTTATYPNHQGALHRDRAKLLNWIHTLEASNNSLPAPQKFQRRVFDLHLPRIPFSVTVSAAISFV